MASEAQQPAKRRALGSLDTNRDLSRRYITTKRAPITFDIENEGAVIDGIAMGIYDSDEVLAYTNQQFLAPHVTPAGHVESESDDDQPLATRAAPGSYGVLEERPVEDFQEEYDEEMLDEDSEGEYEDEDEGQEAQAEGTEGDDVDGGDEEHVGYFDPASMGLKEINNLAHFGVSSHKPGSGVEELLSDDLDKYWQ
jgi:anaphase-promoting complex subunit 10